MHDADARAKLSDAPNRASANDASSAASLDVNLESHGDDTCSPNVAAGDVSSDVKDASAHHRESDDRPLDVNCDAGDAICAPALPSEHKAGPEPIAVVDPSKDIERDAVKGNEEGVQWSIYTSRQKKALILAASAAAFFSPLSGQIYLPALNVIAKDLQVTDSMVNLTVTTYLIMQGLAPSFIGTLSDDAGRRAAYIVTFIIYSAANIGLALQNNYVALLVLRCVQSAGSSGTVALANAIVADLVTSAERGTYVSWTSIAPMLGPSAGPLIGGALAQYVNWHFIFWFLLILTAVVFVPMLFFFPETCRKIVGDGSIPPPKWMRCYTNVRTERRLSRDGHAIRPPSGGQRIRFPNPFDSIVLLFRKEVGFPLAYSGIVGAGFYATAALIPSQFGRVYRLNELQIALCYIPFGIGAIVSAVVRGRTIDARFRAHAKRLGYSVSKTQALDLAEFPIERARLEVATPMVIGGSLATIVLGWTVQYGVHVAVPLITLFVIGACTTAAMNTVGVLIVDIYPGKAGTVTASNNLVRCWFGAASTAAVIPMIDALGLGWTASFFALLVLVASPGLWYIMRQGPKWRKARREKDQAHQARKDAQAESAKERQEPNAGAGAGAGAGAEQEEKPKKQKQTETVNTNASLEPTQAAKDSRVQRKTNVG